MSERSHGRSTFLTVLAAVAVISAATAEAQPYARYAVPDSVLPGTLLATRADYENAWNALFVAHLRASLARADSSAALLSLARRLATTESATLDTRIGLDALDLLARWNTRERRRRVRAAVAESSGTGAQRARDYARADSLLEAALGDYRAIGELRRAAWVSGARGVVAFENGDFARAESLYREALAVRRALGDPRMVGNTLNALGTTNYQMRRYDAAHDFLDQARAVRERTGERAALGSTLNYLGLTLAALGQPDSAMAHYHAALLLTVAQGDSARTLEVLVNLADLESGRGHEAEALALYERARVIAHEQGNLRREGVIENNLGVLYAGLGRYSDAALHYEAAVALRERDRDGPRLAFNLIGLGSTWLRLRDPQRARPPIERALALAESLGRAELQGAALNNLAIVQHLEGDDSGAERSAVRALALATSAGDSILVHDAARTLSDLAIQRRDLEAALGWRLRSAVAGSRHDDEQCALDTLGLAEVCQLMQRLDEAEALNRRALLLARRAGSSDVEWMAINQLGDVAERRGDMPAALAHVRQAAALIDTLRTRQRQESISIRAFGERLFAYDALIHLLGKLDRLHPDSGYAAEAFAWAERARGRSLLDLVRARGRDTVLASPIDLEATRTLVRTMKVGLLAYSVGDSSTSLWIVTPRAWRRVTLPRRSVLRTRIEVLRRGLAAREGAEAPRTLAAARDLYRMLVEPAEPLLRGLDALVIVPDGPLAFVPFEALLAQDTHGERPARGDYLVERFAVSYTPSVSLLAARAPKTSGGSGIVVVADPAYGPLAPEVAGAAALAPLPGTALELAAIRAASGQRPLVALTGAQATRDRVLGLAELPHAQLVHIATHGEAVEVEPERSTLWLAQAGAETGPSALTLGDILGTRLEARLVTLSACETGLGRLERGEGIVGFARAFLAVGAQSVVVSLWKVNDRSTARLMERLYTGLLRDGETRAVALTRAKRALLRDPETRSPFHWAPFVMVGAPGPLVNAGP